ncbi:MAG: type II toxin-antitoxin system RelE/ParE family toxin [Chloroflexota bacterium]|nr:type II toxin-antitoxin system RelE/ParE family toxin [Chloroflexota bacterium]MDP9470698.1 type II toxin-antitoxin system RelE/ParE family toxin [Chloroflexota bacterium]
MRQQQVRRRWRDYRTASGRSPVREFIDGVRAQNLHDAARILAAMDEVARHGTVVARHLRGDIWEVRATSDRRIFRILFAEEGRSSQILLALEGFAKTTRRTPPATIDLAEERLRDWRERGRSS